MKRIARLAVLAALVLSAPARGQSAPDPSTLGPFAVGHESFELVDPSRREIRGGVEVDRTLVVDVWYPAAPGATGAFAFYPFQVFSLGFTSTLAREGAAPVPNVARPLVVFSHGNSGISVQSTGLCETLASHGFVVAAPNHTGNTASDAFFGSSFPFATSARNRPLDVSAVIDRMIARSRTPGDRLFRLVNPFQIGAAGHSFGGFTALAIASGYADVPADPRVRAVMPIAPAARILTNDELARITVPVFVLGGTEDTTTPIEPNSRVAFEEPSSRRVYRADIVDAGHSHFASVCKLADVLLALNSPLSFIRSVVPGFDQTCSEGAFPIAEAERIQNLYAVSFFRRHLAQDSRYEAFLDLPYAQLFEPGVLFLRRNTSFPIFWSQFLQVLERP